MSAAKPVGARGARCCGVLGLAVVLAVGLSGCRPRSLANQHMPAVPPSVAATDPVTGDVGDTAQVGQQDLDSLNRIISSVGGAVTSVRSALGADSPTANG